MPRTVLERTGYLSSFPDMIGSVSTFKGDNADHKRLMDVAQSGGDWTALLEPADVSLCPAVCHPLYPTLAGTLPEGGSRYDVSGWCFRHEPSLDPARMQAFRQHDLVYVGDAERASEHRDRWLQLGAEILDSFGLGVETVVANDPFFGRVGRILAENQRAETLKFEIVTPINSSEHPTAIASANCHLDHFGEPFGIVTADGEVAHSCCFGFGLDRITLALLRTHGVHPGGLAGGSAGTTLAVSPGTGCGSRRSVLGCGLVQGYGGTNEGLQRLLVDLLALAEVDGTAPAARTPATIGRERGRDTQAMTLELRQRG